MHTGTVVAIVVVGAAAVGGLVWFITRVPETSTNTPAPPPSGATTGANAGDVTLGVLATLRAGLDFANAERNRASSQARDSGANTSGAASGFGAGAVGGYDSAGSSGSGVYSQGIMGSGASLRG